MSKRTGQESEGANQPDAIKSELADTAEDPLPSLTIESQGADNHQQLVGENKRLQDKIEQLDKRLKKAVRKNDQVNELKPYQAELIQLQQSLEKRGKKMIIVFEGRGGAGKGGTIRRISQYMNARHYRVVALGKPTTEERSQWFYQKYIQEFPCAGEIVLFDRSWYTRAMIEPVFGFCTAREHQDFMKGVGGFERDIIRQNIILIKLYFSVSREEQARRFNQRRDDPLQRWKLNEVDLDAEEHRSEFTQAKFEMLRHTHTVHAPWTIIRSDIKHQARLNAMKVILSAIDYKRLNPELDITPDTSVVVSGAYELEQMQALRLRKGGF
ncbi:MAG: polyphosphate kinase 2 [Sedimenticola sp.]